MENKYIAWFEELEIKRHDRGFLLDIVGILQFDSGEISGCGASFGMIIEHNYILGILDLFNADTIKECCDKPFYLVYDETNDLYKMLGASVSKGLVRLEPINKKFGKPFEFKKWSEWIQKEIKEQNYENNQWTRFRKYCEGDVNWNKRND